MNFSKENKMGNTHRTMRGKEIDLEKLSLRHETTPAVGNVRVNARGDELGPGGKIVKTREEILEEYYKKNSRNIDKDVISERGSRG
jgi:hypothetical protein